MLPQRLELLEAPVAPIVPARRPARGRHAVRARARAPPLVRVARRGRGEALAALPADERHGARAHVRAQRRERAQVEVAVGALGEAPRGVARGLVPGAGALETRVAHVGRQFRRGREVQGTNRAPEVGRAPTQGVGLESRAGPGTDRRAKIEVRGFRFRFGFFRFRFLSNGVRLAAACSGRLCWGAPFAGARSAGHTGAATWRQPTEPRVRLQVRQLGELLLADGALPPVLETERGRISADRHVDASLALVGENSRAERAGENRLRPARGLLLQAAPVHVALERARALEARGAHGAAEVRRDRGRIELLRGRVLVHRFRFRCVRVVHRNGDHLDGRRVLHARARGRNRRRLVALLRLSLLPPALLLLGGAFVRRFFPPLAVDPGHVAFHADLEPERLHAFAVGRAAEGLAVGGIREGAVERFGPPRRIQIDPLESVTENGRDEVVTPLRESFLHDVGDAARADDPREGSGRRGGHVPEGLLGLGLGGFFVGYIRQPEKESKDLRLLLKRGVSFCENLVKREEKRVYLSCLVVLSCAGLAFLNANDVRVLWWFVWFYGCLVAEGRSKKEAEKI